MSRRCPPCLHQRRTPGPRKPLSRHGYARYRTSGHRGSHLLTFPTPHPNQPIVDIICSVFNGAEYVGDLLRSLQAQTHQNWRLWVRDDGSVDDSAPLIRACAESDPRIQPVETGGPRMGAARSFSSLLEGLPADANYIMCADHDDVWLPQKVEITLAAMRQAERESEGGHQPVLVHTDLVVVDSALRQLHPSFWRYSGIDPEPATLRRIVAENVVTGSTIMFNRALRERMARTPAAATYQDWWYGCIAAAFGRIVAVPVATVLYRQHSANTVGVRDAAGGLIGLPRRLAEGVRQTKSVRRNIARAAAQAAAFLEIYGDHLSENDRRFLRAYSRIPQRRFLSRKIGLMRLAIAPHRGFLHAFGVVLRG